MQTNIVCNSLTEDIQSVMQICRIWKLSNILTSNFQSFQNLHWFPDISRPLNGENSWIFKNFPGGGMVAMLMVCSWSHAHRHEVENLTCIVSIQLARHLTCNSQLSIISFRHLLRTQVNTCTYSSSQSACFVTLYFLNGLKRTRIKSAMQVTAAEMPLVLR